MNAAGKGSNPIDSLAWTAKLEQRNMGALVAIFWLTAGPHPLIIDFNERKSTAFLNDKGVGCDC